MKLAIIWACLMTLMESQHIFGVEKKLMEILYLVINAITINLEIVDNP